MLGVKIKNDYIVTDKRSPAMRRNLRPESTQKQKTNRLHLGFHVFIYVVCVTLIVLFVYDWWNLHQHHAHIHGKLSDINPDSLIIRGNDDISLRNSDLFLRFSHTELSSISILVAAIGALLTFIAFMIQYLFNKKQKDDLTDERFENHLFHFLNSYREICNEMEIRHVGRGKTAFHYMFYEYKAIYNLLLKQEIIAPKNDRNLNELAFTLFLDGVSRNFKPVLQSEIADKDKLTDIWSDLLDLQEASENNTAENPSDKGVVYLADYRGRNIQYFHGHRPRLIPYFHYLFLIFDYLIDEEIPFEKKMKKLRFLSSQMSEHEIGLLYAYTSCNVVNETYRPYLDAIYETLPSSNADRFRFDSGKFIKQPVIKK